VKTNKKNQLILCLLGAIFFALAGCSNILDNPERAETFTQNKTGNVVIEITDGADGSARTLVPPIGVAFTTYELTFTGEGGASHETETVTAGITATVSLAAGNWTITAQAKDDYDQLRAQGSWTGAVSGSATTRISIPLTPTGSGSGFLNYTISFPDLGDGTSAKSLALYTVASNGTETAVAGTPVTDFTSGTPGSISLSPGFYRLNLTLTNSAGKATGKTEALHVYAGLTTSTAWEFTDADFTEPASSSLKLILSEADLEKIGVDPNWPLDGNYVLGADLTLVDWDPIGTAAWTSTSVPLSLDSDPFTGSFDGGGHTITLNSFADSVAGIHYLGIFSAVKGSSETAKATVKNLNIVSGITTRFSLTNTSGTAIGLIAGYTEQAEISNVTLSGVFNTTSAKNSYIGGIVGYAQKGTLIKDSSTSMNIDHSAGTGGGFVATSFYNFVGGFVGIFKDGADTVNCHSAGNVTVIGNISGSQAFAGGIAGGSYYAFTTESQGSISYCSNTGDVFCEVGGFWAWTGGIAGCICGDGDGTFEKTTKVYRSWASGNVTSAGKQWPYTGGITGYIYYGAMVAECYFTGNVSSRGIDGAAVNDYVGGISGYLSKETGHNSRIRDCWSAGTVSGRLNAGGIVGQHQVATVLLNCWSRAEITVSGLKGQIEMAAQQGAGGIAGFCAAGEGGPYTEGFAAAYLGNCVALNPFISAPNGFDRVGRVIGDSTGDVYKSYAWSNMPVLTSGSPAEPFVLKDTSGAPTRWSIDGTDCVAKPARQFYEETLEWNFNTIWMMGGDGYPHLQWEE
jgi:hypothetical protein